MRSFILDDKLKVDYYHEKRDDYVYIKFINDENLESCKEEAVLIINLLKKYKLKKILLDNIEKKINLSIMEEYELANFYFENNYGIKIKRVAAVYNSIYYEVLRFRETVLLYSGLDYKIFTNITKAKKWLRK